MTNLEISQLLSTILSEFESRFEMRHQPPTVAGGGHSLDVDTASCLGTISIWESGAVDWQFVDALTGAETFVGAETTDTASALRDVVLRVLQQVTDSTPPTPGSE
jgi:hypothetical protein